MLAVAEREACPAPQAALPAHAIVRRAEAGADPIVAAETTTGGHCACGGGCPRCAGAPGLQQKLEVSSPGDPLELEADRMADAALSGARPSFATPARPAEAAIQRCGDVHGAAP